MKLGQIFIFLSFSMSLCAQALSAQTDEFPALLCTADFGILMNDAGKCSTYTNGCQRADLIAAGYKKQCDIVYLNDPYFETCLLYTSPSPRDGLLSRMPSSA